MSDDTTDLLVGVDVGGTFTDLVLFDQNTGEVRLAKVPSSLDNQAFGVLGALHEAETDLSKVALIVHGTTTTTNAILERKLVRTGLITTQGFRDVLELGRRTRPQPYGMKGEFEPLIPRNLRIEVAERLDASGNVLTKLDEASVKQAAKQLIEQGCESVVIHFLHAYANPAHEIRAAEIVANVWPNDHITMGHSLLSESREFERGVTAAVNASVQPLLQRYISRLTQELSDKGYSGDLLVMNGNGGMVSSSLVAKEAAKTVMSGPASGVMAAAYVGRSAGVKNLITYDMGGTSTDVALIRNNEPSVSNEIEIEYAMPIHVAMVDVRTVGAGGGSIAKVNAAGLLEVGPESAGAAPGPVCYGKGGKLPTISDANLLLGRLDPSRLKSVQAGVSIEDVERVFQNELGDELGLTPVEAAEAVIRLANTKMAGATRMVTVSLGADPRDFTLFAFGGAGPLHATAIARELAIPDVLVPCRPGITNAIGCLVADLRHDFVRTVNTPLDTIDIDHLHAAFTDQVRKGKELLKRQGVDDNNLRFLFSVDMQFVGQTHLLRVPLEDEKPARETLRTLFDEKYFERLKVELAEIRANVVNVNSSVIGVRDHVDLSTLIDPKERKPKLSDALSERRSVYFDGKWYETPVYWRDWLPADFTLEGPAVIQQMDSTIIIEPADTARSDADGNIIISIGAL